MTLKQDNPLSGGAEISKILLKLLSKHGEGGMLGTPDSAVKEAESKLTKLLLEQRIEELNVPRTYHLDDSKSDDYKQGFADALDQVGNANIYREAWLNQLDKEKHE